MQRTLRNNASNRKSSLYLPSKASVEDRLVLASECPWIKKIEELKEYKAKNGSLNHMWVSVLYNELILITFPDF